MHEVRSEEINGPVEDPYCLNNVVFTGISYTVIEKVVSNSVDLNFTINKLTQQINPASFKFQHHYHCQNL